MSSLKPPYTRIAVLYMEADQTAWQTAKWFRDTPAGLLEARNYAIKLRNNSDVPFHKIAICHLVAELMEVA